MCLQSIPRQVWLDNRTTTSLMQYPVEELNLLHDSETSEANVTVGAGSFIELDGVSGNQVSRHNRNADKFCCSGML